MSKRAFYDVESVDFLQTLEANFPAIKKEFFETTTSKDYQQMRLKTIYNTGWSTFGLRWFRRDLKEGHQKCPRLSSIIKKYDDLVESIGFSIMAPGTIIFPHVGLSEGVLRCHLGIEVPEGDCSIRVDKYYKKWEEGKAFIFDDMFEHEAWNKTNNQRIIVLADLDKNVLFKKNPSLVEDLEDLNFIQEKKFWLT